MAEPADVDAQSPCFRLIYHSHSRIPAQDRDAGLAQIFREARAKNRAAGITGALLITDHYFVQALEGEEAAIRALYERISSDARHDDVSLVSAEPVDLRVFSRWAMAQISASGSADIPLHVVDGAIHSAADRPVTREQYDVLKVMRATIGADTV